FAIARSGSTPRRSGPEEHWSQCHGLGFATPILKLRLSACGFTSTDKSGIIARLLRRTCSPSPWIRASIGSGRTRSATTSQGQGEVDVVGGRGMDSMLTVDGEPRFKAREGWGVLPDGWRFVDVAGVATDSHDRVFVFNRGDHPVIIFDREGRFIGSWGENLFTRPHGITIGPDNMVYCTDDLDHTVKKFTPTGELVGIIGKSGCPSDTGATSQDFRTI